jgi:HK97 family phage portal protein
VNILQKAWAGLKAAAAGFTMRWSGSAWGNWASLTPGSSYNYRAMVGDGSASSIVIACVSWLARVFPEAPLQVVQLQPDGTPQVLPTHPLVELLERPNAYYSGPMLWASLLTDLLLTGNAYIIKERAGARRVAALWWAPAATMAPRWPSDGSAYLSHYEYTPNGQPIRLELADVVHLRHGGLDPDNPRLARSPLASLMAEIWTDLEAQQFTGSILRNLGVPGVVLSAAGSDPAQQMTLEDTERAKVAFEQKFSGDNRGRVFVASKPMRVDVVSFSPQQMDLKALRRLPEERVAAVLGIPAAVAGLGAGLDHNTYSNIEQAREAAYEELVIPLQRLLAADLGAQLLPDWGDAARLRIRFDLSAVRVMQPDMDALMTRAVKGYLGGILTRADARALVQLDTTPQDEVYVVMGNAHLIEPTATPEDIAALAAPAVAPASLALPAAGDTSAGKGQKAQDAISAADLAAGEAYWRDALAGTDVADLGDLLAAVPVSPNGATNGTAHG